MTFGLLSQSLFKQTFCWPCGFDSSTKRDIIFAAAEDGEILSRLLRTRVHSALNHQVHWCLGVSYVLRFKYTTKLSLPKIACPAIVYIEIVAVIDPFFVGVCPWIKVYRYNPTEICQQRLQGVRNVAQKLCSWERSFISLVEPVFLYPGWMWHEG